MAFALTKKDSIIIYGAGEQGEKLIELFQEKKFHVKAVLDRRADELNQIVIGKQTIPIVDPEKYEPDSSEEIVIISLYNAVRHEKIALYLGKKGFQRIIYIPMSITENRKLISAMRRGYNEILNGNLRVGNLPEYSDIVKATGNDLDKDIVYLPIELLFSEENFETPTEHLKGEAFRKRKNVLKTAGENLMNFKPYYQMYCYLDGAEADCGDYLYTQIDEVTSDFDAEKRRVLKDRYELFQIYEKAFELDRDFFVDSAPMVMWNQGGYFNIVDGHHRASYLFYKGIRDIPVRIREEDRKWLKMLGDLPNDFPSESFALVNNQNLLFWRKQNEVLCGALLKKDVRGKKIYINMQDSGYLSRYCHRLGCEKCIDIETGERADFAREMCEIFRYGKGIHIEGCLKESINVDFAVIDEKFWINEEVRAGKYLLKLYRNGHLHNEIVRRDIMFIQLGAAFDGEQEYIFILIKTDGGDLCFL